MYDVDLLNSSLLVYSGLCACILVRCRGFCARGVVLFWCSVVYQHYIFGILLRCWYHFCHIGLLVLSKRLILKLQQFYWLFEGHYYLFRPILLSKTRYHSPLIFFSTLEQLLLFLTKYSKIWYRLVIGSDFDNSFGVRKNKKHKALLNILLQFKTFTWIVWQEVIIIV